MNLVMKTASDYRQNAGVVVGNNFSLALMSLTDRHMVSKIL